MPEQPSSFRPPQLQVPPLSAPVRPMASHASAPEEPAITVELSNGDRIEFPAAMPAADIENVVGRVELSLRIGDPMASHEPPTPPSPSLSDRAVTTGMRIVPTIAGGIIGAAGGRLEGRGLPRSLPVSSAAPRAVRALPPGARFVGTSDGQVAVIGVVS